MLIPRPQIRSWLSQLKVEEALEPDDPRYVAMHEYDRDGVVVRGGDWVKPLYDCITLSDNDASAQLFSGYIGTGKSTELRRLKKHLEAAGYVVLLADAEHYHDLSHPLEVPDLLVILAGSFGEQAAAHVGRGVLKDSYWQRFIDFANQEVGLGDIKLPGVGSDLKVTIRNGDAPFWLQVRRALDASMGKLRAHAHDYIERCVDALRDIYRGSAGVVFILDSMERLRGAQDRFHDTMQSVGRVFDQRADFLHLPKCHVIYTVPPYAEIVYPNLSRLYSRPIHKLLPAVKVFERGPRPIVNQPGIDALVDLIARRVDVEQIFGPRRDLLQRMIVQSGGHVRTLINFMRELLFRNVDQEFPPDDRQIEGVLSDFAEAIRLSVRPEGIALFDAIRRTASLDQVVGDDLSLVARYIDNHIVLCYRNGEGWYEVHPLIRGHVEDLAAEMAQDGDDQGEPDKGST